MVVRAHARTTPRFVEAVEKKVAIKGLPITFFSGTKDGVSSQEHDSDRLRGEQGQGSRREREGARKEVWKAKHLEQKE